ncbi:MAG: sigma-70 family RNA polymerase sigma factor [Clostridia bacterium]|nr:sigma-70 family RNA polymerase sigma factor [Clostridia bacterium]
MIGYERAIEIADLYYDDVYSFCLSRLKIEETADDVTREVFLFFQEHYEELTDDGSGAVACNILCDLLGHKLETGTTVQIVHNARTTAPKCLEKMDSYEICSRCDYSKYTLISSKYISCC